MFMKLITHSRIVVFARPSLNEMLRRERLPCFLRATHELDVAAPTGAVGSICFSQRATLSAVAALQDQKLQRLREARQT